MKLEYTDKTVRQACHYNNYMKKLITFYKWSSEDIEIPFLIEQILREEGSIGYDLIHKCWVNGKADETRDELGKPIIYRAHTLNTTDKESYELKWDEEVIVCGNNYLYKSDKADLGWVSQMDAENDVSMYFQLVNSRNIPIIVVQKDTVKKQVEQIFDKIKAGVPAVITSDLITEIEVKDIIDHDAISKMECLTALHDDLLKRNMNLLGASLETKDKKAQVNNVEMEGFDDYTTLGYLANYEPRLEFCEKMKAAGINIEVIRNPIFTDEPTDEEIETGEREEETDEGEDKCNPEETEGTKNEPIPDDGSTE